MGTYIKTFDQQTEYETYINSENVLLPNLSYCRDNNHAYFNQKPEDPYNGYEYVDLGLPSGLLWAKCNVGAETETDYGDYFMWGDPEPATNRSCNWANYKYSGTVETTYQYSGMTKYNNTDGLTTLELCDDAAHVNMGGNWRMPTHQDYIELLNNTTNSWATINGVNGRLLTGKGSYTGTTLFLPACGSRQNSSITVPGTGQYWTSSLVGSVHYTLYVLCNSSQITAYNGTLIRYIGNSVRGVIGESDYVPGGGSATT